MIDVGAWQRQMNTLKQVPVSVAKILLRDGQDAIDRAASTAKQHNLPGGTARDNVFWKLRWHGDALSRLVNPHDMYASGDDLKKWVLAAYVEANAADEGAEWISTAWGRMWSEIGVAIAALPVAIAAKVNETVSTLFGMPMWLLVLGGLGIAGLGVYTYTKAVGTGHGRLK